MLSDVVRDRRNEVLEYARARLAEQTSAHAAVDADDYLPSLLDLVLEDLDPRLHVDADGRLEDSAADHGRMRQRLGAELGDVVYDFGVICEAVSEVAGRAGAQIEAADWQKLNRALDVATAKAISSYERLRRDQERRDSAEVGSVAHELRNALAAATVAFEAVRRGRVGTDSRTADIVVRSLKRGALLAANLVVQSKAPVWADLTLKSFALRPVVEDVVSSFSAANGVKIEIDVAPELNVLADKELLISAVANLVQNAVKLTRSGGMVTVRAHATRDALVLEVEDECGGLPAATAEALMSFLQEGEDRTHAGLGLSIVRNIMRAHHGAIQVRDRAGRGCIFELSFPQGSE